MTTHKFLFIPVALTLCLLATVIVARTFAEASFSDRVVLAVVERVKVVEYLFNLGHRYGASKARFFLEFGFQVGEWEVFAEALREHAQRHEVAS